MLALAIQETELASDGNGQEISQHHLAPFRQGRARNGDENRGQLGFSETDGLDMVRSHSPSSVALPFKAHQESPWSSG